MTSIKSKKYFNLISKLIILLLINILFILFFLNIKIILFIIIYDFK